MEKTKTGRKSGGLGQKSLKVAEIQAKKVCESEKKCVTLQRKSKHDCVLCEANIHGMRALRGAYSAEEDCKKVNQIYIN